MTGILIVLSLMIIPFQNCSGVGSDQLVASEAQEDVMGCGSEGFEYLHKNYFVPNCVSCHDAGGLSSPAFAGQDVTMSYFWAKTVPGDAMIETSIDNKFCGPSCNIEEGSEMHRILLEWVENPSSCP